MERRLSKTTLNVKSRIRKRFLFYEGISKKLPALRLQGKAADSCCSCQAAKHFASTWYWEIMRNNKRAVLKLVSPWPHLVGCLCRTFAGQDCKQRGGRGLHLCQHQHPLWLRPSACRSLKCLQTSKWTFDLEHALPSSNRSSPKSLLRHSCTSKSPLPWVSSLHLSIDLGQVSSRMGSAATRGAASSISPITSLWQLVDSCASFWITFSFRHSITLPSKKFPPPSLSTRFFPAMRFPQNLGISCKFKFYRLMVFSLNLPACMIFSTQD